MSLILWNMMLAMTAADAQQGNSGPIPRTIALDILLVQGQAAHP